MTMCGIFGYVGRDENAGTLVLAGLEALEYRGYDSWGVAVARGGTLAVEKEVGRPGATRGALPAATAALGHTRWATHGGVTRANAHPHLDCAGRLALIHNGIITNHLALRDELARGGHSLRSETDSEVAVHLLERQLERAPAGRTRLVDALIEVFRRLEGSNALAVLDARTGEIAVAKNGSPLVLGWADGAALVSSDAGALSVHTRRVTYLEDGQAALVTAGGHRLFDISEGFEIAPAVTELEVQEVAAPRTGHPDRMSAEMAEQPAVLRRIAADGAAVERLAAEVRAAGELVLTGCGSAYLAALAGHYLLSSVAGVRATCVAASELPQLGALVGPRTLLVAISQSGETIDVLDATRVARHRGARVAALVNVPGSALWRGADVVVPLGAGPERAVLATKSFTAQLAVLLMTAHALAGDVAAGGALVERAADEIELLLAGERRAALTALAGELAGAAHLFLIGRGPSYPLALEAALKIKEVSYLHAEGFAGGELKHGVIALMEPGTPVVVLAPRGDTFDDALSGGMEVRARGARLIGLAAEPHPAFDRHVAVADLGPATGLVHAVVAQALGYDLARRAGHDPDRPRHLAKSVTVR